MAGSLANNCAACTKRISLRKPDAVCKNIAEEICDVRIVCKDEIVEVFSASAELACADAFISDVTVVLPAVTPFFAIDVLNPDAIDETLEFSYDRDADEGTETYALTPIKIKIYNPDHECAVDSWKGQQMAMYYKIENRDGEFVWRRICGRITNITGSLLAGYDLTLDTVDPSNDLKPKFVNFGTAVATEAALDLVTDFGT